MLLKTGDLWLSAAHCHLDFVLLQGGDVIDKVMIIKDVHGPDAWIAKKIKI